MLQVSLVGIVIGRVLLVDRVESVALLLKQLVLTLEVRQYSVLILDWLHEGVVKKPIRLPLPIPH